MVAVLKTALCVLSALAAILVMVLLAELEDLRDELDVLRNEVKALRSKMDKAKVNIVAYVKAVIEALKEVYFKVQSKLTELFRLPPPPLSI
ncbi:hypothetical protein WR25_03676 [Diploscapter pachys]|uniref:Uncharacterized protein n=1 Tax=Diploscapter pachys TaxID=2018661 RepID=A0A2A2LVB3_9BILA|nr:hypothetical protein WR25_03676 [Diploscapter pachys]